jgi:predicted nucleic acid-binding protein
MFTFTPYSLRLAQRYLNVSFCLWFSKPNLAGVVVEELYAGALNIQAIRLIERYVGALERTGRVIAPGFSDWKEAGKIIARVTRQEPSRKSKVQQMLNDILLALCARRIGADLFTFNRADFELIRRHKPFSLKVLSHRSASR